MPDHFPPLRIDLFALVILLGIVQGFFLAYFFLSNSPRNRFGNRFLGLALLSISLIILDIWLGYTNYMFQVLWLVDATEPLNFMMAVLPFLYLKTSLTGKFSRRDWLHFVPALLYFLYMVVLVYPQNLIFKFNANVNSFHPEIVTYSSAHYGAPWMFYVKNYVNHLTFAWMLFYQAAGFLLLQKAYREKNLSFFSLRPSPLSWYRSFYLQILSLLIVFAITRTTFPSDLGDHLVAAHIAFVIYATSFVVVKRSVFFQENAEPKPAKKYEKSSLTPEIQSATLSKLRQFMESEKPYLDPDFSLPLMARRLSVSTHHLSQILNEELGQSFFDLVAQYRVREAQQLLLSPGGFHLKIEEIAQQVGYNSKSAFNTAFRKITSQTPSEYRRNQEALRSPR
jgi:AraC-like DNA-binding protein